MHSDEVLGLLQGQVLGLSLGFQFQVLGLVGQVLDFDLGLGFLALQVLAPNLITVFVCVL